MLSAARKQATLDASRVGARARGRRAAADGAAAVAAVRDHARARGREQPARGGAAHPAHHGREPGLARRRAVGGRREPRSPCAAWTSGTPTTSADADYLERRARDCASRPTSGWPGRVWQRHLPLWIPDLAEEPMLPLAMLAKDSGLHGAFAIPLRNGPEVIGVMAFFSTEMRAGQRRSPVDAERAGRPDRPVHGAQADGAGPARQRGALPLGDRRARRGHHPRRQRRAPDRVQRQRRTHPGARVDRAARLAGRRSVRVGRRRGRAHGRRPPTCRSWSRCARARRARTACSA